MSNPAPTPPAAGGGATPAGSTTASCPAKTPAKKVIQITATVAGTNGVRKASNTRPTDHLRSSSSSVESLTSNPPAIVVRGCHEIHLTAVTTPAGQPVDWSIKPNENTESPPRITPTDGGKKATLITDKAGSFAVTATLGTSKVVWNVVFVWVKVDPASSVINSQDTKFADTGSTAANTGFKSGDFVAGSYCWDADVKVEVLGGGNDKKLGIDKVKIHIIQNGIADTLTGNYEGGGTALEKPKGGLPILDSNSAASPFLFLAASVKVTPSNSGTNREIFTGDSPAGGFPGVHIHTHKRLQSISGQNSFQTYVVSVSDDATHSIVAHASTIWSADFSGTVDAAGKYTPAGAHVGKQAQYNLISDGTGGLDCKDAGVETFEPRFNGGTDTIWTP